jgi:hypothetical protein
VREATIALPYEPAGAVSSSGVRAKRLALKFLLVLLVCEFSARLGYAIKIPPHNISRHWPAVAVLFRADTVFPTINSTDCSSRSLQQKSRTWVGTKYLPIDRAIVFLTGHGDIPQSVQAMKAVAIDFFC